MGVLATDEKGVSLTSLTDPINPNFLTSPLVAALVCMYTTLNQLAVGLQLKTGPSFSLQKLDRSVDEKYRYFRARTDFGDISTDYLSPDLVAATLAMHMVNQPQKSIGWSQACLNIRTV